VETLSVEEYEMSKQERLLQRWKTIVEKHQEQKQNDNFDYNKNSNNTCESLKRFWNNSGGSSSSNNSSICSSSESIPPQTRATPIIYVICFITMTLLLLKGS
jgi:hypothetical protein